MAAHHSGDRTGRNLHRFSLDGTCLSPYYGCGDFLKAKHQATEAAADRFPDWVLDLSAAHVRLHLPRTAPRSLTSSPAARVRFDR
jgi:hypothetical protein